MCCYFCVDICHLHLQFSVLHKSVVRSVEYLDCVEMNGDSIW